MKVRLAQDHDAPFVLDLDIKCFDYYWSVDEWNSIWKHGGVCTTVLGEPPIAFCVSVEDIINDVQAVHIPKIAVHERARGSGLGKKFLASLYDMCKDNNISLLAGSVPLTNTFGCEWMSMVGMDTNGIREEWVDGQLTDVVLFTKEVKCSDPHRVL